MTETTMGTTMGTTAEMPASGGRTRRSEGAARRPGALGVLVATAALAVTAAGPSCIRELASDERAPASAPAVPPPPAVRAPQPVEGVVAGGIRHWHVRVDQVPLVSLTVMIPYGAAEDPAGKQGLAALTAAMLDEGAGERDALELADEIDYLGATISVSAGRESSAVTLHVLRRNLDAALGLVADIIMRPRLEEKDWQRVRALWLNRLAQNAENPAYVARLAARRVFFGDAHPYGLPEDGVRETVEAIGLEDVRRFHRTFWRGDASIIISAGAIEPAKLAAMLDARFKAWRGEGRPPKPTVPAALPGRKRPRIVAIDKPGSTQTYIYNVGPGISRRSPDYAALTLANVVFGGSFTSRLMQNLREKHGYTYGAGSDFMRRRGPGTFVSVAPVKSDRTGEALAEFAREYGRIAGGMSPAELAKARATIEHSMVERLETLSGTVAVLAELARAGLPASGVSDFLHAVETTPRETVEKAARAHIRWDRVTTVLVGDLATIRRELAETGLGEAEILDTEGRPVSSR